MSGNVLEQAPSGAEVLDDPDDMGPEVPGIIRTAALPGLGKWLAGVSGNDGVADPAPWSGVECFEVVPDRSWVQVSGALPGDEAFAGILLDFDIAGRGKSGLCQSEANVEATAARTEGQASSGR